MVTTLATLSVLDQFSELHSAPILVYASYYLVALLLYTFLRLKLWYFIRRRILRQTITTHYEPPFGLNPPEISYLFSKKLDASDFAGLLLHMARRGVVHFRKHHTGKSVLPGPKYEGNLKIYERHILDVLDEFRSVDAKDLLAGYTTIFVRDHRYKSFQAQVEHELLRSRHVKKIGFRAWFFSQLKPLVLLLGLFVWLPLMLAWLRTLFVSGTSDIASVFAVFENILIATILALLPAFIMHVILQKAQSRTIGRRQSFRLKPTEMWSQLIGYRQYVKHIRSGKLRFEAVHTEKDATINTLPYAIALDEVSHWRDLIT